MNLKDFRFTKEHEWVKVEDGVAAMGITDYAQHELGDVVYVELPAVGDSFAKGDAIGNIESVKAVSDVYAPVSGEIVETNENLEDKPESINQDPYGDGWIVKIKLDDPSQIDELMSDEDYQKMLDAES